MNSNESSHPRFTRLYRLRHVSYYCGLVAFDISFIFFLIGFSTSHWTEDNKWGPWDSPSCSRCDAELLASRILLGVSLASYFLCFGIAVAENGRIVDSPSYHSRKLEILIGITGIICVVSIVVFCHVLAPKLEVTGFGWSMIVTALAQVWLLISMTLVFYGNKQMVTRFFPTAHNVEQNHNLKVMESTSDRGHQVSIEETSQIRCEPPAYQGLNYVDMVDLVDSYSQQLEPLIPHPLQTSQPPPPAYRLPPSYPFTAGDLYRQQIERQYESHTAAGVPSMDCIKKT